MSARRFDDFESTVDQLIDSQAPINYSNITTKLGRRRRIEDIDEERRLREELHEY